MADVIPIKPPVPGPADPGYVTNLELILSVVQRMRLYQRQYFLRRDRESLIQAKVLEAEVDRALAELSHRRG